MSDTNEYEERNRAAKAYKLVRLCEAWGVTAELIERRSDPASLWAGLANVAGVNPASDRTKAIVLHILRERSDG